MGAEARQGGTDVSVGREGNRAFLRNGIHRVGGRKRVVPNLYGVLHRRIQPVPCVLEQLWSRASHVNPKRQDGKWVRRLRSDARAEISDGARRTYVAAPR